jgi:hypothetical protein
MAELTMSPPDTRKFYEIVEILKKNRSTSTIKAICETYALDEGYVEQMAEHVGNKRLNFESAPPPKGRTMSTKPSITDPQIKEILRIFRVNGHTSQVRAKVAKQYGITESLAGKLGDLVTESGDSPALTSTSSPNQHRLAEGLRDAVVRAESKPIHEASHQDLEALAAAYFA